MKKTYVKSACIAALSAAVLFTGCGKLDPNETLVTIKNGDKTDTISLGLGNFAARYQQSMYDQYLLSYYGEGMWKQDMSGSGSTLQDETKDGVLNDLEEQYLAKAHAEDYSISLTDEQKKAIEEAAKKFISDNDKDSLEQMGATEDTVKEYLEYRTYYNLVADAAKKEADKDITDDDCWMRTFSYVLFDTTNKSTEDGSVEPLTDDEILEKKANAKALAEAEDFDAEVEALEATKESYSYHKGESEDSSMDMEIIKAAESLKEGEVSAVIEVKDAGYYVIKLEKDHDTEASDNKRSSLQTEAFNTLMDSWKEAIEWTVDDKVWEKVQFTTLFKAPEKEEKSTEETEATTEESTEETVEETSDDTTEEATEETTEETTENTTEDNSEETEDSESN
ncbi:peptidyl-prolyl cis-trans isomerase [Pseudobutyrivibrio xylanivorans]|uniref:Foldase protein PrsA n=1 Tax=Pseudobutyrivibrio xylanivorans DSM 14809 TaxID=1123012 RepID=A0A1M6D700_PSEXY|nr:peptidyl-prolyl cis-trans isomerase [Pseudobutyrivibrio xylanivorans]SHI68969.1 foldase protein PrsA [Pseudobutyrivibrio xylanivorans DSM 14809]